MNTVRLTQARRLFCNDLAPIHTQRHNMRAWVRSVRDLSIATAFGVTHHD